MIFFYRHPASAHNKPICIFIAIQIFQFITEVIIPFLINCHDSPFFIGLQHTQRISRKYLRTHHPTIILHMLLIIRPSVNHAVFFRQNAIHRTSEHFNRIYIKHYRTHPIIIMCAIHIIISLYTCCYFSPSLNRSSQCGDRNRFLLCSPIHHSLPGLRVKHHQSGTRGSRIFHLICIELQRVYQLAGICMTNLHVQMRAKRIPLIPTQSNNLTGLKNQLVRFKL